mgnify:CR=1 FL=1
MKKLVALVFVALLAGCQTTVTSTTQNNYTPKFVVDYQKCGADPAVSTPGAVSFGTNTCNAGRVVSDQAYKNISKITATVDLSRATSNFVNHTFYMVSNPTNPARSNSGNDYCDAGGNLDSQSCREIDIFESNANAVIQTTIHTGGGGASGPQRFELSYTDKALNTSCYDSSKMSDDPAAGSHKLAGIIDITKPVQLTVNFTYDKVKKSFAEYLDSITDEKYSDTPTYKVTYTQGSNSVVVYDSTVGSGYSGSGAVDMKDLTTSMANGYWLHASIWQSDSGPGWSPGSPQGWWNGSCGWDGMCGSTTLFSITDVTVTAD